MNIPNKFISFVFSMERYILYLLICFSVIFFLIAYFIFFPKVYSFECFGETTRRVFSIPDNKIMQTSKYNDSNTLTVSKYFFGNFYSINNMPILKCSIESDSTIICEDSTNMSNSSYIFNFMKSKSDELTSISYIKNNQKIEYESFSRDCKLMKNVLN
jgi:hypothetical protein